MNRKVIFILVGGFLILVLIFVLWFWFFGRHNKTDILPGNLGSGQTTDGGTGGNGTGGNGQAPIGSNSGSGTGSSGNGTGSNTSNGQVPIPTYSGAVSSSSLTGSGNYLVNPPGVWWYDGSGYTYSIATSTTRLITIGGFGSSTTGGGFTFPSGFDFDQTPINTVNNGTISGNPYIEPKVAGADGTDISVLSSLFTVVGGCLINYTAQRIIIAPATTGIDTAITGIGSFLSGLFGLDGATPLNPTFTSDIGTRSNTATETVSQCLTRTLGRLAVQKITDSTVAWINSGFDGQPAYVQDFNKFFSDVADEAAGAYIQSSDFAFLCSPFKLQVRIAVAQSYARRSSAPSCTLSQVTGNINSFMKGNFSQGGWGSLITFTTQPSNNPYGAYITLQGGLQTAVGSAQANANLDLTLGQGFLSVKDKNGKITTPGRALVSSFDATTQSTLDSLQLGDSIDQILGALSNALITKLLYNGLSTIHQGDSTPSNRANTKANNLMEEMRGDVSAAQQYAGIQQRIIADIQNVQEGFVTLANCWTAATSTNLTTAEMAQATTGYETALAQINTLQTSVDQANTKITNANKSIVRLQQLQTDLLLATVSSEVNSVENKLDKIKTTGNPRIYTNSDVTTATQDRTTLQTSLEQQAVLTTAQLQQCHALAN